MSATRSDAPIVILGSGRSGTTWILDTLAEANGMQTVFEPLHPQVVPEARLAADRYVTRDDQDPELTAFMDKVMSGSLGNIWTRYRIRPDRLWPTPGNLRRPGGVRGLLARYQELARNMRRYSSNESGRLMFKFIRANLMLDWLSDQYQPLILFVVRHPAAVVASKLKLWEEDWDYRPSLERYLGQARLVSGFLPPEAVQLKSTSDKTFGQAVVWCIENMVPLQQCANNPRCCVVFYETLIAQAATEWPRIIRHLQLEHVPSETSQSMASQQARHDARLRSFDISQIGRWQTQLDPRQCTEIQRALDIFGITVYRVSDPMPVIESKTVTDADLPGVSGR